MKRVIRNGWETTDGSFFEGPLEAEAYQVRLNLGSLITALGIGAGGEWSPDMIAHEIYENRFRFKDALNLPSLTLSADSDEKEGK